MDEFEAVRRLSQSNGSLTRLNEISPSREMRKPVSPDLPMPVQIVESYVCPRCKGKGFVRMDVPFGHPQFGKAIPCQCKTVEAARKILEKTYSWLGMGQAQVHELEAMTFASFQPNANGHEVLAAYRQARSYAKGLRSQPQGQRSALITGPYGVGKTHLACAIVNTARNAGLLCLFTSGNDLFQALYARGFDEDIIRQTIECDLLCVDDLSEMQRKEDGSYQKSTLFTIFNQRYLARRPVIITASEQDDWRAWLHASVLSRLFGNAEHIRIHGCDYRMRG